MLIDVDVDQARAIREAAARSGTSLLEMANRLGCNPQRLVEGTWPLELVAQDTGFTVEQIQRWGQR